MCTVLVVSLKTTMEKSRYNVRSISDGRPHFVLVWRKILLLSLVRDKHCFVFILYPCICNFLNSITILCAFCVNYSLPKLGTRVRLIRGCEDFTEKNLTHVFLFLIYDVHVTTVSSLIK